MLRCASNTPYIFIGHCAPDLLQRQSNDLLLRHTDDLHEAVRSVRRKHPFEIHGWVVLPDHLHCVISLPPGDADFAIRWRLIKLLFSRAIPMEEWRKAARRIPQAAIEAKRMAAWAASTAACRDDALVFVSRCPGIYFEYVC